MSFGPLSSIRGAVSGSQSTASSGHLFHYSASGMTVKTCAQAQRRCSMRLNKHIWYESYLSNNVVSGGVNGDEAAQDDGGRVLHCCLALLDSPHQGLQMRVLLQGNTRQHEILRHSRGSNISLCMSNGRHIMTDPRLLHIQLLPDYMTSTGKLEQ